MTTLYIRTCSVPPGDYLRAWRCGLCGTPRDPELPCSRCGWLALPEELDHEVELLGDRIKNPRREPWEWTAEEHRQAEEEFERAISWEPGRD